MNKINYKESIDLISPIKELLIINIDENLTTIDDNDFIVIKGEIRISGEAKLEEKNETFTHPINIDISLSKQQLSNDQVKLSIDDFTYNLNNNFIDFDLFLKIDGLKELDESFLSKDDREIIQVETEDVKEDTDIEDTDIEDTTNYCENVEYENEETKSSLLTQLFKNRNFKKESVYLIHVVKDETTYEEIASLYNIDLKTIKESNEDKEIKKGQLIFIPK